MSGSSASVVDRLSKYSQVITLKHPYAAKVLAEIQFWLALFGKKMFKSQGTKLKMSTVYHPQTDGQTEVI